MVVCVCRLDLGDRHQWCVRLLHYDVRSDLRERTLHQLADLHGGVLLRESLYYTTAEGELNYCMMGHWIGFQMLTEVRDEDYPYNPHFYLTFIELHFATM